MGRRLARFRAALDRWPRAIRIAVAVVGIVIGIAGVLVPIVPGWPLLLIGIPLLLSASPALDRAWRRFLERHPRLHRRFTRRRTLV